MQRPIQRAILDVEHSVGRGAHEVDDAVAVEGPGREGPEDQGVEGSAEEIEGIGHVGP